MHHPHLIDHSNHKNYFKRQTALTFALHPPDVSPVCFFFYCPRNGRRCSTSSRGTNATSKKWPNASLHAPPRTPSAQLKDPQPTPMDPQWPTASPALAPLSRPSDAPSPSRRTRDGPADDDPSSTCPDRFRSRGTCWYSTSLLKFGK